jgi:hypothetical protein
MEWSPSWESNNLSANQEILHLICSLKVHYYVHKSLPLDTILIPINADCTLTPYFLKTYHNIITPSLKLSEVNNFTTCCFVISLTHAYNLELLLITDLTNCCCFLISDRSCISLTLCSPNYSCQFRQSGPNKFSRELLNFIVEKQPMGKRNLRKTNLSIVMCQFELHIGLSITESVVEFDSTLDP